MEGNEKVPRNYRTDRKAELTKIIDKSKNPDTLVTYLLKTAREILSEPPS